VYEQAKVLQWRKLVRNVTSDFQNVKFHKSFIDCVFFLIFFPVEIGSDIMYIGNRTDVLLIEDIRCV
jgi:hypothetical protein